MSIYTSSKSRPYVYKVTHKISGEFYFGYRKKNVSLNLTSDIDFPNYKTSAPTIRKSFDQYDWVILAEFEKANDAYDFEQQLIYENWGDVLLLNKSCFYMKQRLMGGCPKGRVPWNKGKTFTKSIIRGGAKKGSIPWNKGVKLTEEQMKNHCSNIDNLTSWEKGNIPWNKKL